MKTTIGIIDYGMGNLHSVKNACDFLGLDAFVSDDPDTLASASALILPGVGAFPDAMARLTETGLDAFIRGTAQKKPLLGICLGMQLLFERGHEFRTCEGLGLIPGEVIKMHPAGLKIPHMGWNGLTKINESPLMDGIYSLSDTGYPQVYFVHSYRAEMGDRRNLIAAADYGEEIPAVVQKGLAFGCQFHPEKSEAVGLAILKNFGGIVHDHSACH